MNDVQPYQFEPEGTLEEEDDSNCFEETGIVEETLRITLTGVCVNSVNQWIPSRNLFVAIPKFELYFSRFKCEMYITTSRMAEILMPKSNYNLCSCDVSPKVHSNSSIRCCIFSCFRLLNIF